MAKKIFNNIDSIQIENVTKKYGDIYAVKDLNLDIEGGELLILIGSSGSGKTTALRTINRLIEPDEGRVTINGQDVMEHDPVKLRRNIGYVIQNIGLFPHMTIGQNIGLVPKLEGWKEEKIGDRTKDLLDFVSLEPEIFMDRYPRQLSGGQQQRVGLARALAMDPPLLLMDEPFGALDPILRRQLQDEFVDVKKELGKTIVFVTHDIEEAFKLGDRVAIMNDAQLVQVGTPEELIFNPENDMIASIVDSNRKFKHMDTLKVRELMSAMESRYILDPDMDVTRGLEEMAKRGIETGILMEPAGMPAIVTIKQLQTPDQTEMKLGDIAQPSIIFSPADSVSSSLEEMKHKGRSIAVVMEREQAIGILLYEDIFLKLV